jgi:RNA polymerase sigma-70 factor (ECF subfamily)
MQSNEEDDLTAILNKIQFSKEHENLAFRLVYQRLREIAASVLAKRKSPTLSPSDLLHAVYLKRLRNVRVPIQNRQHFFSLAAQAMTHELIDQIRAHGSLKRSRPAGQSPDWHFTTGSAASNPEQFALIHPLLQKLKVLDEKAATVFELRLILGFTIDETADILNLSPKNVRGDWDFARVWLRRQLGEKA